MLRPSFIPPVPIRRLRDLTRYRIGLVSDQTREKNRVETLLEDSQIKLSVVASDIFGVSGRQMLAALISGQRNPQVLAQMARTRMRTKIPQLEEAFVGHFTDHHSFLLAKMLARIDALDADIADLDTQIEAHLAPFADAVARLDQIPGVGATAAAVIIAEVGLDMTRFPTPAHLSSWARFAPGVKESAGRKKGTGSTGHGDRYLARVLGEAAAGASKTNTFLGERYRRIARRRGNKKAIVAVGRSILVIVWYLLSDPEVGFHDLGSSYYDSPWIHHGSGSLEWVGAREYPSDLGEYDLSRVVFKQIEGHPRDASFSQFPSHLRDVRRSQPRVMCGFGSDDGVGGAGGPD
jgi:transposase